MITGAWWNADGQLVLVMDAETAQELYNVLPKLGGSAPATLVALVSGLARALDKREGR